MYIILNGKLIKKEEKIITALGQEFNYGYGLFETIKLVKGRVFFLKEHIKRLQNSCKEININYNLDYNQVYEYIKTLIKTNDIIDGSIKLIYTKEQNLIISNKENNYTKEKYQKGFSLCFSSFIKNEYSPIIYHKSMNYLENILAKEKASEKGYNETILLNTKAYLSEGTYTNLFFVKDDTIYTPDIKCGILAGIMREKIIDLINHLELNLKIGEFTKEDLQNADEIFLTNSLAEIMPVNRLEDKIFDLNINRITNYLKDEFYKFYYEK